MATASTPFSLSYLIAYIFINISQLTAIKRFVFFESKQFSEAFSFKRWFWSLFISIISFVLGRYPRPNDMFAIWKSLKYEGRGNLYNSIRFGLSWYIRT